MRSQDEAVPLRAAALGARAVRLPVSAMGTPPSVRWCLQAAPLESSFPVVEPYFQERGLGLRPGDLPGVPRPRGDRAALRDQFFSRAWPVALSSFCGDAGGRGMVLSHPVSSRFQESRRKGVVHNGAAPGVPDQPPVPAIPGTGPGSLGVPCPQALLTACLFLAAPQAG